MAEWSPRHLADRPSLGLNSPVGRGGSSAQLGSHLRRRVHRNFSKRKAACNLSRKPSGAGAAGAALLQALHLCVSTCELAGRLALSEVFGQGVTVSGGLRVRPRPPVWTSGQWRSQRTHDGQQSFHDQYGVATWETPGHVVRLVRGQ